MTFSIMFFGPRHRYWDEFKQKRSWRQFRRAWFYRPDEHSTGGIGFCIPGLHVVFTWGNDKKNKRLQTSA